MDISLKHENYKFLKTNNNTIAENTEAEFSLPEYMPEILRIIKSNAIPKIHSCNIIGDRITVDGMYDLRMVYVGDDNGIYAFSSSKPFTAISENEAFENAVDVDAEAVVSFVNCRATSTRQAQIKAGVTIKLTVYKEEIQDIISLEKECKIEEKCKPVSVCSSGCKKTKPFSLSDTISLTKPSAFILNYSSCAILTETRKINNKIMVKGDAVVNICYVNAENKTCTEEIKHIMPINQILEFDGMEENFDGEVLLKVTAVDVVSKGESNGVSSAFDVSMGINACINMWEEKEIVLICDAYSTEGSIDLKKQNYIFYENLKHINETFIFDSSFSVAGEGVSDIIGASGEIGEVNVIPSAGCLTVNESLSASFIIKDKSSNLSCVNKTFDFSHKLSDEDYSELAIFSPDVKLISLNCSVKGENSIIIKAEIMISGCAFTVEKETVVTDITESDRPFVKNDNAITVYFPEIKNESLWSIAGRYNTTVKAIAEENGLEGDTTESKEIIFIP